MDALDAYIVRQAQRPPLSTGFPTLDKALDGGFHDGLYVLGAVSSLGKTAFCMQMADALARQRRRGVCDKSQKANISKRKVQI